MTAPHKSSGFSLIEIIVTLVLLSIIGVFGTLFLVNMAGSYKWADDNAHLSQKAQMALTRITNELTYATTIDTSAHTITYDAVYADGTATTGNVLAHADTLLTLNAHTLSDSVTGFVTASDTNRLDVTLTLTGANGAPQSFTTSIAIP
jgi:prepilin-type N-terminal cleavage/methylation domain-containing protein